MEDRLKIIGRPGTVSNKEIKEAITFYTKKLMPRLLGKISIFLVNVSQKNLGTEFSTKYSEDMGRVNGFCNWLDSNDHPREFQIHMNKDLPRPEFLIALAHEMVHVKQYARNEMKEFLSRRPTEWHGVPCEVEYYDQPWEIEAYSMEFGLFNEYVQAGKY